MTSKTVLESRAVPAALLQFGDVRSQSAGREPPLPPIRQVLARQRAHCGPGEGHDRGASGPGAARQPGGRRRAARRPHPHDRVARCAPVHLAILASDEPVWILTNPVYWLRNSTAKFVVPLVGVRSRTPRCLPCAARQPSLELNSRDSSASPVGRVRRASPNSPDSPSAMRAVTRHGAVAVGLRFATRTYRRAELRR